ncbi:MAG: TolC family outer membrane protein [Methylophilaceae bacterium]
MIKSFRGVLLVTAIFTSMPGFAASPATLKEIVEKTVTTNPEVQANFHNFQAALEEQKAAKGGFFPHLDLVSTFRSQEQLTPNVGNTESPDRQTQLVLRQMLFDGFATSSEVNRLDHAARVRYYELLNSMQNASLDLVRSYIDIQRYKQLVDFAKENYIVHKQLFDRIEERVTAGVARKVDLEQASGRLALAEANLLTETTNLQNVSARFQRLSGELPPDTLQEVDFFKDGIEPTANQALQLAYKQNPELLSSIENIEASQQEVEGKRAKYYPRLDLQGRKSLETSSNGKNSSVAADLLELTATFNLFNGFTDKALIDQAGQKLNTAQDLRDKACVDTRQTLVIAYNDVLSLKEQLGYRDQHQLSIEKAREAYRKQFDIGQRTLLDLLDTENEYFQARRTYTITQRDLYTAYARTYASQGDLLNKLGVTRGGLPDLGRPEHADNYATCQAAAPEMLQVDKAAIMATAKPLSVATERMMAAPAKPNGDACSEANITARVNDWADAWRHKDADGYMSFYADTFTPEPPLTRDTWEKQRKSRLTTPAKINLDLSNIKVTCDGNNASANFDQDYSMTTYKLKKAKAAGEGCEVCAAKRIATKGFTDKVNKTLQFENSGSQWKIVRELVNN